MLASETGELDGARVAIVGVPPTLRVIAKLFTQKQKHEVKFCKTGEEALAWLKRDAKR